MEKNPHAHIVNMDKEDINQCPFFNKDKNK